jgi:aspartate 1-decarboxylase
MLIEILKAKLHQARVTGADLNYVGSITIDADLLSQAGLFAYEKVLVVNIENGARFETYIIRGQPGSGEVVLNGAAARLVARGDRIIVMAFTYLEGPPPADYEPRVLVLDEQNRVASVESG